MIRISAMGFGFIFGGVGVFFRLEWVCGKWLGKGRGCEEGMKYSIRVAASVPVEAYLTPSNI